jgi:hypothetical protein
MARSRFLEDDDDPIFDEHEAEVPAEDKEDDEGFLEDEETIEELDVDARGHVRPRRRDDEEIDPEY